MEYRDLLPGRVGGRVIASHIRITKGGEVPDYVHYHKIGFQMIFCKAGWVRVVYENQGEPFVLEPGDCVLQPPGIRHRVLEASEGAEVIEVSSPAEHETWVEHEIHLPVAEVNRDRLLGGQKFVRHVAKKALRAFEVAGCEITDTGISLATNGSASVRVLRATAGSSIALNADGAFVFLFVLSGRIRVGTTVLGVDECHSITHAYEVAVEAIEASEFLEVMIREI